MAVTRRYYRSGESEYLINKNTVRLKDINELFMDTGLGRDGYSIIGQGKIDSIVAARSEDRREIFEEAAGISRYRYRKEESERRLNKAEENLVRLRDILSELEDRVEPLRSRRKRRSSSSPLTRRKRAWRSAFGWRPWTAPAGCCESTGRKSPWPRPSTGSWRRRSSPLPSAPRKTSGR